MNNYRNILLIASLTLALGLSACEPKGPAEKAGESIDNAVDNAGDSMDDAVDNIEDAADDVADDIEDATN